MTTHNRFLASLVTLTLCASTGLVQAEQYPIQEEPVNPGATTAAASTTAPQPGTAFTQAELDQMLAPIALYPDALLSQIMMAATYPLEVVEAARWSRANPQLKGQDAVKAVDDRNWDPSVKSLVAFPQVITMMDEKLDWTERLGDAFLAQQSQVMDTVQQLRHRADAAGNLQSTENYQVVRQGPTIVVESPPEVVYVPYYDPLVIYGAWWWPAYRPVYWHPWPGYYWRPGYVGFSWSVGVVVGHGFFFGACDWPRRNVRIVEARPFYYHRIDTRPNVVVNVWHHEPEHRRGVPYRHTWVQQQFRAPVSAPPMRREIRRAEPDNRAVPPGGRPEHHGDGRHEDRRSERRDDRRGDAPHTMPIDTSPKMEPKKGAVPPEQQRQGPHTKAPPNRSPETTPPPPLQGQPGGQDKQPRGDDRRGQPHTMPVQPNPQPERSRARAPETAPTNPGQERHHRDGRGGDGQPARQPDAVAQPHGNTPAPQAHERQGGDANGERGGGRRLEAQPGMARQFGFREGGGRQER